MPAIFGYYFQYLAYVMLSMLIVTLCPVILTLNRKRRSRTHNVFKPDVSKLQQTDGSWGKYLGV